MTRVALGVALSTVLAAGLATVSLQAQAPAPVKVELKNGQGQAVGTATLTQEMNMVHIALDVKGLTPGQHAIHVHMTPTCEGPAFTSAGGHFNPAGKKHGAQNPEGPHAGDMPVRRGGRARARPRTDCHAHGLADCVAHGRADLDAGP